MRVLIIEDDEAICTILASLMCNKEVETALTLSEGFEILKRKQIDIVVLDGHLPDTNNPLQTVRLFRQRFPDMPYIVISGDKDLETIQEGALDFILKPNVTNIDKILDHAIEKNETRKKTAQVKETISEIKQIAQELKSSTPDSTKFDVGT